MNKVDIFILAAGRGSRLGPLTEGQPKAFVPFFQSSLIEQNLQRIRRFQNLEVSIVTGYQPVRFQQLPGTHLVHNPHWQKQNMLGSLQRALQEKQGQRPLIVAYSDIYISEQSLNLLLLNLKREERCLPFTPHWERLWNHRMSDPLEDLESFKHENGFLKEIGLTPKSRSQIGGQFMGLIGFSKEGRQTLRSDLADRLQKNPQLSTTGWIQQQLSEGLSWKTYSDPSAWLEIDSEEDWLVYKALAASHRLTDWGISFD